jgi:hypothetical protein
MKKKPVISSQNDQSSKEPATVKSRKSLMPYIKFNFNMPTDKSSRALNRISSKTTSTSNLPPTAPIKTEATQKPELPVETLPAPRTRRRMSVMPTAVLTTLITSAATTEQPKKNRHKHAAVTRSSQDVLDNNQDESSNNSLASSSTTKSSVAESSSSLSTTPSASCTLAVAHQQDHVFSRLTSFINTAFQRNSKFEWPYISAALKNNGTFPNLSSSASAPTSPAKSLQQNSIEPPQSLQQTSVSSNSSTPAITNTDFVKPADVAVAGIQTEKIVVPNWRIRLIKVGFRMEGTENTNDDCFLKRHQKHENEEVRIKRRDMRWQRDEMMREKLLKGRFSVAADDSATSNVSKSSKATGGKSKRVSKKAKHDEEQSDMKHGIVYKRQFDVSMIDGI